MNEGFVQLLINLGIGGVILLILTHILNKRLNKANLSKTEEEAEHTRLENIVAKLKLDEIVKAKEEVIEKRYREIVWSQEKTHYEVKLDLQERQIKLLKEKNECEQENEILKNELHLMREQIDKLEKEVLELQRKLNKK